MKLTGDRNQCQGCKQYFNSTAAFEKHRVGEHGKDRRCLNPDEMQARGMVLRDDGFWRGSAMPEKFVSSKEGAHRPAAEWAGHTASRLCTATRRGDE